MTPQAQRDTLMALADRYARAACESAGNIFSSKLVRETNSAIEALSAALAQALPDTPVPVALIDMVLHCPKCGMQHVDAPETTWKEALEATGRSVSPEAEAAHASKWTNPPHRSHLCLGCGHVWRPADVPTNGVQAIKSQGANDSAPPVPVASMQPLPDHDNHHNALKCPYCNPRGLVLIDPAFAAPPPPAVEPTPAARDEAKSRLHGRLEAYAKAMTECGRTAQREGGSVGARDCSEIRTAIDILLLETQRELRAAMNGGSPTTGEPK